MKTSNLILAMVLVTTIGCATASPVKANSNTNSTAAKATVMQDKGGAQTVSAHEVENYRKELEKRASNSICANR